MTTLVVTYAGPKDSRFDREYYCNHHLPLVNKTWKDYGLETISAFFPQENTVAAGEGTGIVALCLCGFRDDASLREALASAGTPAVMNDVPHFTDLQPSQNLLCKVPSAKEAK